MAVRKNTNGTWTADFYDINGKRVQARFTKRSEADDLETTNKKKKIDGKLVSLNMKKERVSIEQVVQEFKTTKSRLRFKSIQKYSGVIDQFLLFCKSQDINYLDEFTPDNATNFYKSLVSTDSAPKTINFYLLTVKALFKTEVQKDRLLKSPFDSIKNLPLQKKIPDYYSAEELKKFFSVEMHESYRNVFIALLNSGMRFGEIANLSWDNVDLENKLLHIRSSNSFNTKTVNSERVLPLNETMFNLLKTMAENNKSGTYVFSNPDGNKLNERTLLTICKRVAKAAGISGRSYLHKFRHTFASHLIQRGIALEQIQKLLGHASITDTLIYAHIKPQNLHSQVAVLDDLLEE